MIPDKKIKSLDFTIDAGKILIEDILIDDISIKNSVGDTNVNLYGVENFDFKGGANKADIKIVNVSNMNVRSDVGAVNVEVDEVKTNIGQVVIE